VLEGPCSNHAYPIKHLYKDNTKDNTEEKPDPPEDNTEEKEGAFLEMMGYLMIFGGTVAYDSKCRQKLTCCEVYMAESATPAFLRWSTSPITFD
jgi:hypothetical protein